MKKHILFILLFFPLIVNAKINYDFNSGKEQANNYINNFTKYNDYIITNAMYGYNGEIYQDANFNNGGFLNKYEFELSKDGTGNTYLFTGQNYWTMTKDNNKYYLINNNNLSLIEETQQQPIRITEYIKPMTRIKGSGTYMDPWMFLEPKEIKITYNNNGGSGCEEKIVKQGDTFGTLCTPNKNNTSFLGWYTENSFRNEITDTSIINFDENMILYAKWDGCNSGTYLNNTTNQCENCPTSYTSNKGATSQNNCYINVPAGKYVQTQGSSTLSNCQVGYNTVNHTVNYGNASSCSANTYTVSYNANGGSGSMNSTPCTYGQTCTLRNNTLTRTNYTFLGWSTSVSATTAAYTSSVTNLTTTNGQTVTLYAVWQGNCSEGTWSYYTCTSRGYKQNRRYNSCTSSYEYETTTQGCIYMLNDCEWSDCTNGYEYEMCSNYYAGTRYSYDEKSGSKRSCTNKCSPLDYTPYEFKSDKSTCAANGYYGGGSCSYYSDIGKYSCYCCTDTDYQGCSVHFSMGSCVD